MKNKKKLFIIGGAALAAVCAVILLIVFLPKESSSTEPVETKSAAVTSSVVIDEPGKNTEPAETGDEKKIVPSEGSGLTPVEEKESGEADSNSTGIKAEPTAAAVSEALPETDNNDVGGAVIGGNTPEVYNCGTPGHHCNGPETHAYVLNLELEGCPYCGSNKCASFYATDEWGNTCYTPSKCPKYDVKKDPVYYCQTCGKKCGDGKGGTCVQFVEACNCPNCKSHVNAWTCHSCK